MSTSTLGGYSVCLKSADVEDGAEVDLGDGDHDEYLCEREAAVYLR